MNPNDLKDRIKQFAHRSVKLSSALPATPLGKHIRLQLIKCSTSAAANYRAACIAQSRASFCSKLSIVVEETDESCFWMEFIITEKLLDPEKVADLLDEGRELTAIFVASRKTANNRSSEFIAAGQTIVNYNSR
ncbi:MAG TPA: four helix bundle protein [Sedimentisphaerales bacterium]|nr:four helix bundle protein [Sedimentisphaerales bacterium]